MAFSQPSGDFVPTTLPRSLDSFKPTTLPGAIPTPRNGSLLSSVSNWIHTNIKKPMNLVTPGKYDEYDKEAKSVFVCKLITFLISDHLKQPMN
jgi:hypothetical protein